MLQKNHMGKNVLDLDLDSYAAGLVRHTRSGREMFGA